MKPRRTWLFWLNFGVLQWGGVRLARMIEQGPAVEEDRTTGWAIMFPVLPLTGWWSDYRPKAHWLVRLPERFYHGPRGPRV